MTEVYSPSEMKMGPLFSQSMPALDLGGGSGSNQTQGLCGGSSPPTVSWPLVFHWGFSTRSSFFSSHHSLPPSGFPISASERVNVTLKEDSPATQNSQGSPPSVLFATPFRPHLTTDHVSQEQECQAEGVEMGI